MPDAQALWMTAPSEVALRDTPYAVAAGMVEVAMIASGISRGTERLVLEGRVPRFEQDRMRAPFQDGEFTFPLKYGYAAVGRILSGDRAGEVVFALHPHQTRFAVPADMAVPVPADVPPLRAVLAANMETALNVVWDAGVGPGDRVAVVGAGVVGALAGWLCARIPGAAVELIDIDVARQALATTLCCGFARPEAAQAGADVVIHTSASAAGLATALTLAGPEALVVEASWHGDGTVQVPLGGAFHSQRLRLVSSQVGAIPPARAPRWTYRRRLGMALSLLADPALDALISGETPLAHLPGRYAAILADPATLCHRVTYP